MSTSMNLTLTRLLGKSPAEASNEEIYTALLKLIQEKSASRTADAAGRKLYYISAEFLIGKLLSNNLINLGLYDEVRSVLAEAGKNLSDIEELEPEPSLGRLFSGQSRNLKPSGRRRGAPLSLRTFPSEFQKRRAE